MAVERSFSEDPMVSILVFGICLIIGIASKQLLQGSKVPYTVALLVIGVAIGCLEYGTINGLGKFGAGIRLREYKYLFIVPSFTFQSQFSWANLNADLLLAVFLPALPFESSFSMDPHYIKRCMVQMFLLAGPGVLISTFLQMVLGQRFSVRAMIKYLVQASVGSVGIGLAFWIATFLLLRFIFNDTVVEITLTLAVSYIAYFMTGQVPEVPLPASVLGLGAYIPPEQVTTLPPFFIPQQCVPQSLPPGNSHVPESYMGHFMPMPAISSHLVWQNQEAVADGSQLSTHNHYQHSQIDQNISTSSAQYEYE